MRIECVHLLHWYCKKSPLVLLFIDDGLGKRTRATIACAIGVRH